MDIKFELASIKDLDELVDLRLAYIVDDFGKEVEDDEIFS